MDIKGGRAPFSEPGGWTWTKTKQKHDAKPEDVEVIETDNPITDVLLGPDGKVIRYWTQRPHVPFGYQSSKEDHET